MYGDGQCDCGCEAVDVDCETGEPPLGCAPSEYCSDEGFCVHDATTATSCAHILNDDANADTGAYLIDPDGPGGADAFAVFCFMDDGLGWTLALKIDGVSSTFSFHAPIWTSTETDAFGTAGPSTKEAALAPFYRVRAREVHLAGRDYEDDGTLEGAGLTDFVVARLPSTVDALVDAFYPYAEGEPNPEGDWVFFENEPTRALWLDFPDLNDGDTVGQTQCNRSGIDIGLNHARVRLGMIADNDPIDGDGTCASPDGFIGVGGGSNCPTCGAVGTTMPAAGANMAGAVMYPVFAYVSVRDDDFTTLYAAELDCAAHAAAGRTVRGFYAFTGGTTGLCF
jgi:hypothetical protein